MNCYATLNDVKADLGITATSEDTNILRYIEAVSRAIDRYCSRRFYVGTETRYQTPARVFDTTKLMFDDDLLSVTTFSADSEGDGTYDGETWTENTDYWLQPFNVFPKLGAILTAFGNYGFVVTDRYIKVVGNWGYGDGRSATPYVSASANLTATDGSTTAPTVSAIGGIKVGHTLLVESEQIYVSAISGTTLTVRRGMNGTSGASHAAKAAYIYEYPADIRQFCAWMSATEFKNRNKGGFMQERMGDYFYMRMVNDIDKAMLRILGPFIRGTL